MGGRGGESWVRFRYILLLLLISANGCLNAPVHLPLMLPTRAGDGFPIGIIMGDVVIFAMLKKV